MFTTTEKAEIYNHKRKELFDEFKALKYKASDLTHQIQGLAATVQNPVPISKHNLKEHKLTTSIVATKLRNMADELEAELQEEVEELAETEYAVVERAEEMTKKRVLN